MKHEHPVLTTRQLNRALLARQLLLERSSLPLARALERVAGLQSQYAPSAYVASWSRLRDFRRDALTRVLEQRRVVQATLMRATIHIVSAGDYPLLAAGVRGARREWWLRVQQKQLEGIDMAKVAARVRTHLEGAPRRATALQDLLRSDGFPRIAALGAGMWVDLVRVPPSGTWDQPRVDLYALADEWLDAPKRGSSAELQIADRGLRTADRGPASEAAGIEHIVRRYLAGFGPASLADLASWSGLPPVVLRPVLDRLRLRRFRDEQGDELLDLRRAVARSRHTSAGPVPAHLGRHAARPRAPHADPPRAVSRLGLQLEAAALRVHVFPRRPGCRHLALRTRRHHDRALRRVSPAARRDLDDEAERLAAFHRD